MNKIPNWIYRQLRRLTGKRACYTVTMVDIPAVPTTATDLTPPMVTLRPSFSWGFVFPNLNEENRRLAHSTIVLDEEYAQSMQLTPEERRELQEMIFSTQWYERGGEK